MLAKVVALAMTVLIAALALEMVLGVHLGIEPWMHRVLDPAGFAVAAF